jgi:hypothetical protein
MPGGSATLSSGFTYVAALPPFTDDPLTARGTVVKAAHITELRQRVDQLRARYGLAPFGWTDASLVPGTTPIRAVHVAELRAGLNAVYTASGRTTPTYTQAPVAGGSTVVRVVDVAELRSASRSSLPVRRSPSNHGLPASPTKKGASHLQQPTLRPAATRRHACRAVRSWPIRYVRLD